MQKFFVKVSDNSIDTQTIIDKSMEDNNSKKLYFVENTNEIIVNGNTFGLSKELEDKVNSIRDYVDDVWEEFDLSTAPTTPTTPSDAIDLGLPSGLLWCSHNVGAASETDYGLYFSWGNVEGHEQGSGYNFSSSVYSSTSGASLTGDIATGSTTYDAATANMGGDWRLPTKEEFQELYDNTDTEWTTINGVNGYKFKKKSDNSVYVFFPASGAYNGTSLNGLGSGGAYWSSSFYNSSNAYELNFYCSDFVKPQYYNYRYLGISVRAVYVPN